MYALMNRWVDSFSHCSPTHSSLLKAKTDSYGYNNNIPYQFDIEQTLKGRDRTKERRNKWTKEWNMRNVSET